LSVKAADAARQLDSEAAQQRLCTEVTQLRAELFALMEVPGQVSLVKNEMSQLRSETKALSATKHMIERLQAELLTLKEIPGQVSRVTNEVSQLRSETKALSVTVKKAETIQRSLESTQAIGETLSAEVSQLRGELMAMKKAQACPLPDRVHSVG
jgi:predicted RNase H-like nuclease (RuvC/YqgF family)